MRLSGLKSTYVGKSSFRKLLRGVHAQQESVHAPPAPEPKQAGPKRGGRADAKPKPLPARWLQIEQDIGDTSRVVVAHVAPSVRVVIGEALGYGEGLNLEGPIISGLRALGFDYVFDTMFTADLTIVEEGHELIQRIHDRLTGAPAAAEHPLPMFTSCCPGWIQLVEKSFPELLPHVSSCKSPQMMMGAIVKTFFAEQLGVPPSQVTVVSVMPCVRKQPEADRDVPEFAAAATHYGRASASTPVRDVSDEKVFQRAHDAGSPQGADDYVGAVPEGEVCDVEGAVKFVDACQLAEEVPDDGHPTVSVRDVDHVLTTMDIAAVFQEKGIDLRELPAGHFDAPLGMGAGAGQLFGTTGGVMEAALRTAYELVTGAPMTQLSYDAVRGLEGVRTAAVEMTPSAAGPLGGAAKAAGLEGSLTVNVAVVNGLGNAKKVAAAVRDGTMAVDFVEVMACPGGCIGGGGNPRALSDATLRARQLAVYGLDERATLRRSHENPFVRALYTRWLGTPNSHLAHELLHTHYVPGGPPPIGGEAK